MYSQCKRKVKRMQSEYKAKDASGVKAAASAANDFLKQAGELIADQSKNAVHPSKLPPPPAQADVTKQQVAPSSLAATSTTAASQSAAVVPALATATSTAGSSITTAREYIDLLEKYTRGDDLSPAEMEDALYAQHLCMQANILAQHPTFRPWYSDINLANVLSTKRTITTAGKCLMLHLHSFYVANI